MASIKLSPSRITFDASLFRVFSLRSYLNSSRRRIGTKLLIACMANEIREQSVLEIDNAELAGVVDLACQGTGSK